MVSRLETSRVGMGGVLGVSLGLALVGVAACGDGFGNDCRASRTCLPDEGAGAPGQAASNGGGGASESSNGGAGAPSEAGGGSEASGGTQGGAAGDGGAPMVAVPDCVSAADCDDHLACNGAESCDDAGHCASGEAPVCVNPDEANCETVCVEVDGGHECVLSANDTDLDGHTSALCTPMPGDDCDDAQETVFKGAPELCDRLDNDCDKKVDLADGLKFSGKSLWVGRDVDNSIRAEGTVMAWSDASKLYGLFWKVRGLTDLVVALYDAKGVRKAGPTTVGHASTDRLAIAAGETGFAVVWNSDDPQAEFRTVGANGELGDQVSLTNRQGSNYSQLALAWSGSAKRWEVVADHSVASVSQVGVGQPFVSKLAAGLSVYAVELVAAGSSFVLGVSGATGVTSSPHLYRYAASSSLKVATDELTFDNPNKAATLNVAARADGSFVAVASSVDLRTSHVTAFDATGKRSCGYVEPEVVSDVASTAAGYTLVLSAQLAASSLRELSTSCVAGLLVPTGFSYPYQPTLRASPSGYCNVWSDDDGNTFYSIFGSNYCD